MGFIHQKNISMDKPITKEKKMAYNFVRHFKRAHEKKTKKEFQKWLNK